MVLDLVCDGVSAWLAEGGGVLCSAWSLGDCVQVETWEREGNRPGNYCGLDAGSGCPLEYASYAVCLLSTTCAALAEGTYSTQR